MTREEAIDILKLSNPNNIMSIENEEHQRLYNAREEAYKMAISELEKEPCEDAISREKALNIACQCGKWAYDRINELPPVKPKRTECDDRLLDLANAIESDDSGYWTNKRISSALRNIEKSPSVTQKSGKWIYDETLENWRCSKCNETPKTMGYVGTADFMAEHFKFCNHCGAKMESEAE